MKPEDFRSRIANGTMDRRSFTRALAAAGLGVAMLPAGRAKAQEGGRPVSLTWSGYNRPEFFPAYMEKYGQAPEMPLISSPQEDLARLQSGFEADIAHPYSSNVPRWNAAGVLKPIDTGRLTHWADLVEGFTTVPGAQDDAGQQLFLPVDWGTVALAYRTDQISPEGSAWDVMWNPELRGRLAMIGDPSIAGPMAALHLGLETPFDPSDDEMDQILDSLREQRDLTRFFWEAGANVEQALVSGEVAAAPIWNGSLNVIRNQGAPVDIMPASAGMLGFVAGLVLIDGAAHEDAAYELMDAILSPETGKFLIETYGFGHANAKAFDMVSPETITATGLPSDIDTFLDNAVILEDFAPGHDFARTFQEVKSGF